MKFKLDAVRFAEENGNHKAAEKFGVTRKRIIEWKKNKDVFACIKKFRKRNEGGGRKSLGEGMEENLAEWIHDRRAKGLCVSGKLVCAKAKNIFQEIDPQGDPCDFVASSGWLQKFMKRHSLSFRAKTTQAQKDPERLIDKLVAFVLHVRRLRKRFGYVNRDIIAMDETAIWQDMLPSTTIETTETKTIRLKTTDHEKTKVTVCLTAKAEGSKLKPLLCFLVVNVNVLNYMTNSRLDVQSLHQ